MVVFVVILVKISLFFENPAVASDLQPIVRFLTPFSDQFFWQKLLQCSRIASRSIELALSFPKRHLSPSLEHY